MTAFNESDLEPPPEQLCRIAGVAGILLQQDGRVLVHDFPLTDTQTGRISELARAMCQGFRKARRILRQVVIGYPCGQLLVVSRDDCQLVLLLLDDSSLNEASESARDYLEQRLRKNLRLPSDPGALPRPLRP
jgi:hypothetical protein